MWIVFSNKNILFNSKFSISGALRSRIQCRAGQGGSYVTAPAPGFSGLGSMILGPTRDKLNTLFMIKYVHLSRPLVPATPRQTARRDHCENQGFRRFLKFRVRHFLTCTELDATPRKKPMQTKYFPRFDTYIGPRPISQPGKLKTPHFHSPARGAAKSQQRGAHTNHQRGARK